MSGSAAARKRPARRCTPVQEWPAADQRAWDAAIEPGDVLDPGGAGASWRPRTRAGIAEAYGRWLCWLDLHGQLDRNAAPEVRVIPDVVAAYIRDLQQANASCTVLIRVHFLASALSAMFPHAGWDWLWRLVRRLKRQARPVRNKRDRLVPAATLFALGQRLMSEAESQAVGAASRRAVRYRDGLMVALLAARPLRRRNFTAIEVGRHLIPVGAGYVLTFRAEETKTGEPLEFPFPANLIACLRRYLDHYRPVLLAQADRNQRLLGRTRGAATNQLWVSTEGSAMSETGLYDRIVKLTSTELGRSLSPHLFRDCAATSVAYRDVGHLHINKSILGHASIATSERYYNHAQMTAAHGDYQSEIMALRRSVSVRGARAGTNRSARRD